MPTISASTMSPASRRKPLPAERDVHERLDHVRNAAVRSSQFPAKYRHPPPRGKRDYARDAPSETRRRALTLTIRRRHEMNLRANAVVRIRRGTPRPSARRAASAVSFVAGTSPRTRSEIGVGDDRETRDRVGDHLGPSGTRRRGRFRRSRPRDRSRGFHGRVAGSGPHSVGPVVPPSAPAAPARAPERSSRRPRRRR